MMDRMNRNKQVSTTESRPVGALITWPRRYNLLTDVYLLGRGGKLVEYFATASGIRPGDRAIDIGCGPGRLANALARKAGPQGRVTGVDASGPMIEYATAHAAPTCTFELVPAQSIAYPEASFDVATSTFAMHHIPESERKTALTNVFRILRPGGRLLLADTHPTRGLRGMAIKAMARLAAHREGSTQGHDHDGDVLATVDVRRYRDILTEIGFTTIEFREGPFATGILTAVKPN
ncbi:bifunctional demethylmenaquinone methyltransferase/2-methoxy-6-polyprenyl-1,4-benzoquinol methylase UbiE [Nocardia sp. JMUB6875]